MGNYCKTCEQKINERDNEINRLSGDLIQPNNNRKNIKEKIEKSRKKDILDFVPEIIFLQRKIKKFLS